ncbi:ABC transporter permease [Nocardiopsis sp. JB363]|uniref:ABC transporter permease n=1 Tax=Nocardiopsis sp. JB363 TaxID=1434837 RepID=UPI00097AEF59|nr:ABC transporter permease [Nocardiopsis sp. JB363]SIO84887.1 putative ABC transporter integral membrane protein [Nocardiopsis sp. JB363]
MLRTTLAGLRMHKARYVTTTLAILLGVMFISGTMVFADTLEASYEESVMGSATNVDTIAVAAEQQDEAGQYLEPEPLTEEHLEQIRSLDEVAAADGVVNGHTVLLDAEGRAVGSVPPLGVSVGEATRFTAGEGALPTTADEVALSTTTASETGFEVGDTVTLLDPDRREREFTVTGLVNFGIDPQYVFGGAVVMTEDVARQMTGAEGFGEIDVLAAEGATEEHVATSVAALLGDAAEVESGTAYGERLAGQGGAQSGILRISLLLFGVIAMFVASIVIYNTFAILIAQRQREMALLRCVGAKRGQVFRSVLIESFVVGLVSSVLGVSAGVGAGFLGAWIGGPLLGADVVAAVVINPNAILAGLLVGTLMTVFSALVPAMRATRVSPLAALRTSATAAGLEKGTGWPRVVFGVLTFMVSGVLVTGVRLVGPHPVNLFVVTGAALLAFLGVVVLGPLLVRWCAGVLGLPLRRMGVPSMLAVDNSTRNPRRAATAMIALTVGATLITGYSVVSATVESTMTKILDDEFPADYRIDPQFAPEGEVADASVEEDAEETGDELPVDFSFIPDQVRSDLEREPSIESVFSERYDYTESDVAMEGSDGTIPVTTYHGAEPGTDLTADLVEGDLADLGPGTVILSEDFAVDKGVGDTVGLASPEGELEFEIVAVAEEMQTFFGATVITEDYERIFPEGTQDSHLMIRGVPEADPAELREAVYSSVDDHPTLQVASDAEVKNQFSEMMDVAFYTIAAMLGLAIIIAVFGISNTMALSVLERTRESAMLRALGLTKAQLRRMLAIEAVLLCLIGAGVGIVLGVVFGWAASVAVLPNLVFTFPGQQIAVFITVAIVAGLLSAVLPARRAAGTSITGALGSE